MSNPPDKVWELESKNSTAPFVDYGKLVMGRRGYIELLARRNGNYLSEISIERYSSFEEMTANVHKKYLGSRAVYLKDGIEFKNMGYYCLTCSRVFIVPWETKDKVPVYPKKRGGVLTPESMIYHHIKCCGKPIPLMLGEWNEKDGKAVLSYTMKSRPITGTFEVWVIPWEMSKFLATAAELTPPQDKFDRPSKSILDSPPLVRNDNERIALKSFMKGLIVGSVITFILLVGFVL